MKIYLAASYAHKEKMSVYRTILERNGHTVTSRWIDNEYSDDGIPGVLESQIEVDRTMAYRDLTDINKAEVMLFFAEPTGTQYARGGRHVEFGYFLAKSKLIISIGYRENIFHTCHTVAFAKNFNDALTLLEKL
jgi:nucleoside 2-deoxyribosyltransferase